MTYTEDILREWEHQRKKWGLYDWELRFSNGRRNLGYCDCNKKVIFLSKAFMKANSYSVLKDTLLHEIAHAVQFVQQGTTDHSSEWKEIAQEVGCTPRRCASTDDVIVPRGKYVGICPSCEKITHFYRKIKRRYSCRVCSNRYDPDYELEILTIEEYETGFGN